MNFFCRIFGHTWTHQSDNPRTSWNTDKDMLCLTATPHGALRMYEKCIRCNDERNVREVVLDKKEAGEQAG